MMTDNNNNNGNNNLTDDNDNNDPWATNNDPWTRGQASIVRMPAVIPSTNEVLWRERERRQRTVRAFLFFLFLLLMLEDDPQHRQSPTQQQQQQQQQQVDYYYYQDSRVRRRRQKPTTAATTATTFGLETKVWQTRQVQDEILRQVWSQDDVVRYQQLIKLNEGRDITNEVEDWAQKQVKQWIQQQQQNEQTTNTNTQKQDFKIMDDEENQQIVWHYPWNVTGLFLGEWKRLKDDKVQQLPPMHIPAWNYSLKHQSATNQVLQNLTQPKNLEQPMLELLKQRRQKAGVYFLPQPVQVRDDHNLTSLQWDRTVVDANGRLYTPIQDVEYQNPFWKLQQKQVEEERQPNALPLTQPMGRVALRLYARPVPGMAEMSVVDGSMKLLDRQTHHISSAQDVVIRVRGVLFHRVGQLSLVSGHNAPVTHSALIVQRAAQQDGGGGETNIKARRRLMEWNQEDQTHADETLWSQLREDIWAVHGSTLQSWVENNHRRLQEEEEMDGLDDGAPDKATSARASVDQSVESTTTTQSAFNTNNETQSMEPLSDSIPSWSDVVIPFPYILDDSEESFRQMRTPASRRLMPQERLLESNAAHCHFEIDFQVEPVEWTLGGWRKLVRRKFAEKERLKPSSALEHVATSQGGATNARMDVADTVGGVTEPYNSRHWPVKPSPSRRRRSPPQDEALVMVLNGTIRSDNCHFHAQVNATALRTDWEVTTSRAMNYSFYMMLVCLAQIIVLLRQLLHSQSQSAATRVSMVSIGWQTVIDGLLCLGHIYLSLALNNLFTPFASVSFFKLLIFCVIEMKYMAIIISAQNSANGGQPTEVLRRQVAILHLRYYVALFGSLVAMFYATEAMWRRLFFVALYSFWVPQIVLNVITQAKTPLHKHFIYGMSVSRLVAPLYVFCVKNNFLREVYPDVPYDPFMGQVLVLWVGLQAGILMAQSKYGARFMIPPCLLPPKFDYSRPIPASMLPPGAMEMHTDPMEDDTRVFSTPDASLHKKRHDEDSSPEEVLLTNASDRHTTSVTTRMRRTASISPAVSGGGAVVSTSTTTTTTTTTTETLTTRPTSRPTLDCCICYDAIDIRDRSGYMLAPCDHLFHRGCLIQWMDVKMECPICRSDLPSL